MAHHENPSFAAALRSVTRLSFFQNKRLHLTRQERQNTQRERDQIVLARARTFLPEAVIAQAMQVYGKAADTALGVTDPVRLIRLARKDGQEVRASSDPFQDDDLYYLSPDQLWPETPRQHRPKEPDWCSPGREAANMPEYYPPADLTQLFQEPTALISDTRRHQELLLPVKIISAPVTRQRISIGEALRQFGYGNVQTSELTDLRLEIRLLSEAGSLKRRPPSPTPWHAACRTWIVTLTHPLR